MRLLGLIIFSGLIVLLGAQVYSSLGRQRELTREFGEIKAELTKAKADGEKLQADLRYFVNPANLEKELRARFNFRDPKETMIIIVPQAATSSPSSTGVREQ